MLYVAPTTKSWYKAGEVDQHWDGDEDPERDEADHADPKVTHRGSVQGYSPGCLSAYQSPEHVESGSSGGPHHGWRSKQISSPKPRFMTQKKKVMSDKASVIESAMTQFRIVVVTAAPYVVVTGVSGSLYNSRFGVRGSIPRRRQSRGPRRRRWPAFPRS